MAIGQDIAKTFILPQQQIQRASLPGSSPVLPQKANQAPSLGFDPAEELILGNEKLVQDYYDKYNKLRSFASMMNSAGIDVTAPDFDNPASIEANQLYQKAAADLMRVGDMMKEMRKTQMKDEEGFRSGSLEIVSPEAYSGVYGDTVETARAMPIQFRTSPIDLAPEVEEVNQIFAKSFEDKGMRLEAQKKIDELIRFYEVEHDNADSESSRKYAKRQLLALGKALYNPNKDEDQALEWTKFKDKKKEEATGALHRFTLLSRVMQGDTQILEAVDGIDNVKVLPSGVIQYREKTGTKDGIVQYEVRTIDLTGDKGEDKGLLNINALLNKIPGAKEIAYEQLKDYQPVYTDRFGKIVAPDFGKEYFDKRNFAVESMQKARPGFFSSRGSKDEQEAVKKMISIINNRASAGMIQLPMGLKSKDGATSSGKEVFKKITLEDRGERKGGDYYTIRAVAPNDAEYDFEISTRDAEKLQLLFDANPEILDAIEVNNRESVGSKVEDNDPLGIL